MWATKNVRITTYANGYVKCGLYLLTMILLVVSRGHGSQIVSRLNGVHR